MNLRIVLIAIGAGIAAFLLVTVLVIELLPFEFSALVGLPAGLLAGATVFDGALIKYQDIDGSVRHVTAALAGFGYAIVVLLGISYANLGGFRSALTSSSRERGGS